MNKVIRTMQGSVKELNELNELLDNGWNILSIVSFKEVVAGNNYILPAVEYVLQKDAESEVVNAEPVN